MSENKSYAYYPGCSQEGSAVEYDMSTRAVFEALDMKLVEVEDWSCCGSSPAHAKDNDLQAALAGRNLQQVMKMGRDGVTTGCPSCLSALKVGNKFASCEDKCDRMNELLDEPLTETVPARSTVQVLLEDATAEQIREKAKNPLLGLKPVAYYGCLMTRPQELMEFDDEENPMSMDTLLAAAGADVQDFPFKTECCGVSLGIPKKEVVMRLTGRILDMAVECGANCVIVACPLCHMNLDLRQKQVEAANGRKFNMPVLYFSQALALAMGVPAERLGFDKHAVDTSNLLKTIFDAPPKPEKAKKGGKK